MTYLIHFTNTLLDFWLWVSQGLGGGSDLWEERFTLLWPRFDVQLNVPGLRLTIVREYTMHDRKCISLFRFVAPAGLNCVPNAVLQPLVLSQVRWTG